MTDRLIRLPEVMHRTSLSRSCLYRLMSENRFPKGYRVSHKVSVWKETEVDQWIREITATGMSVGS